jgi:hypothetical protein
MANPLKERVRQAIVKFLAGDKRAVSQGAIIDRISSDWRVSSVVGQPGSSRRHPRTPPKRARALFRDDPYVNGLVRDFVHEHRRHERHSATRKTRTSTETERRSEHAIKDAWEGLGSRRERVDRRRS